MFKLFKRYREVITLGALLVVPFVYYLAKGHRGREPNVLDRLVLAVSAPLQFALTWSIDAVGDTANAYLALRGAREEADACRGELSLSRAELNSLEEQRVENERLKAMLRYVENTTDQEIVARVIGLNPSAQFQSLRINRGEDDGVRVGMPVVTPDGVVGQVVRSVGSSADVLLLTDPNSRIGAVSQRTRVRGSVSGTGDGHRLSLNLVRREDDVQNDDVIVTAGSDGIFPRGLLIGVLRDTQRPPVGMFLTGTVVPSVDLSRVEEVLVIPVSMGVPSALVGKEGAK
jgi:rod shape-determining protein MreC